MKLSTRGNKRQRRADEQTASRLPRRLRAHGFALSIASTAGQGSPQLPLDFPVGNLCDG